jgi:hypothetical protein
VTCLSSLATCDCTVHAAAHPDCPDKWLDHPHGLLFLTRTGLRRVLERGGFRAFVARHPASPASWILRLALAWPRSRTELTSLSK